MRGYGARRKDDLDRANGRWVDVAPLCAVQSKRNYVAVGSHFGHAHQGLESDPGKASKLVERMEAGIGE